jgi:probable F420-dependent oxidoreductase
MSARAESHRAQSWGVTIPLPGLPLAEQADLMHALPGFGYTDAWSAEVAGTDAFTPLILASQWAPSLRLGTAIVPVYTRGPALIAMSAATVAALAPGRFVLGLGASSPVIVQDWNGMAYEDPYRRARDVVRFVRAALAGERVGRFALENPPATPPPILLAALRPQMLRLAGREADGAILNWLAPGDVPRCVEAIGNPEAEVVARIFVCPSDNPVFARSVGRRLIAGYLTVPAYAAFHDWLGRGEVLREMHERWAAGDRAGAAAAVPDDVVDALVLHGAPEACRDQVRDYVKAGVATPVLAVLPPPWADLAELLRRLAP